MMRRGPIVAGAVSLILAVLAVFVLLLPKSAQVGEARDRLDEAEQQEQALRAQVASLREAEEQAAKVERQIGKLAMQVPPTADLPGVIRLLAGAADRSAVDFFSVSPGTPTGDEAGGFSVIPAQINVTGGYFALDEFLFRLETLPRAAKVLNVSIAGAAGGEGEEAAVTGLSMQLAVEFYTTDVSAGPGSIPGPTEGAAAAAVVPISAGA